MNNTLQNNIFSKIGRFVINPKSSFSIKKKADFTNTFDENSPHQIGKTEVKVIDNQSIKPSKKDNPASRIPSLEVPIGILEIIPFQKLVAKELANVQANQHQSFVLQLGIVQKNCDFLSETAQKVLALDCMKLLQKSDFGKEILAFSPTGKLWILFPNLNEKVAMEKAKIAFMTVRKLLREELDVQLPLVDLNMYKVGPQMPVIQ